MIKYRSNKEGKAKFVNEVLSPMMEEIGTGWYGAEYEYEETTHEEYVFLLTSNLKRCKKICVTGDSIRALIEDVFKNIG